MHSGQSVAIDGDTALTGSDGISGLVSVYERDNSGFWNEDAPLISGESTDAGFGHAIALDADTALVGAWMGDGNSQDSGVAYIFARDSSGQWSEQQQLSASDGAAGDSFGYAVALDGNRAVIGARGDDGQAGTDVGAVYVFLRNADGEWREPTRLTNSTGHAGDAFGTAVATDGGHILVGAHLEDIPPATTDRDVGAAYLFSQDPGPVLTIRTGLTHGICSLRDRLRLSG